jgi:hypothetical protein
MFLRLQVATACFSCSPPNLNFLDPYFAFMYVHNNHCHRVSTHLQLNKLLLALLQFYYYYYYYYYLTAVGLTPGGSRIHLHTNSTQNTKDGTHITITMNKLGSKLGSAGRGPSLRVIRWHLPYN